MTARAGAHSTNVGPTIKGLRARWRDVRRKVRQVGLAGTVLHCWDMSIQGIRELFSATGRHDDPFDAMYGTETSGIVGAGALDVPDQILEHTNRYEPVATELFLAMLNELRIAHSEFTFVDLGAGKGKALLLAARFPFLHILGVEVSAGLAQAACRNIARCKDQLQKCRSVQVICQDARSYELPKTGLVVFFYNPFDRLIMHAVLAKLEESVRSSPRKVYVLYHRALHRDLWDGSDIFDVIRSTAKYVIYESRHASPLPTR